MKKRRIAYFRPICLFVTAGIALLLSACTTIPVDQRAEIRQELVDGEKATIAALVEKNPALQAKIDQSVGTFVGRMSGAMVALVGSGNGLGVLRDREKGTLTYMNVTRLDAGIGAGAGKLSVLVVFETRDGLEAFRAGLWKSRLGIESGAGASVEAAGTSVGEGATVYVLGDTGATASATARLIKVSVNEDLTDSGVSAVGIPNRHSDPTDTQGEDAPRIWDHKLPFMAQKVVDLGYDLPLPYGIGAVYSNVTQDMILSELEVGINGREKEPFEFVSFDNAKAESETLLLKLDAWILPFMNVYATVGPLRGDAPMDVILDGNEMLEHLEIECSGIVQNPLCSLLGDKEFSLPIRASFSGTVYGIGTVLAGGWNDWFVAVPINYSYADMDTTESEGHVLAVAPRFGRVLNLDQRGNLSLFAGGNYLDSDLTVTGQVSTPDGLLVIDYTIQQENTDKWNLVVGTNWDFNKRWSWSVEYNGFIGSREAFITSFTRRF